MTTILVSAAAVGMADADAAFLNSRALSGDPEATVECARAAGAGKLVALSAINADEADEADERQPSRVREDRNRECEQLAAGSGLEWVSLRPTVFASHRDLRYAEPAPAAVRERFAAIGFPAAFADAYIGLLEAGVGRPAPATDAVPRTLGPVATPFAQWVDEHRFLLAESRGTQHV